MSTGSELLNYAFHLFGKNELNRETASHLAIADLTTS